VLVNNVGGNFVMGEFAETDPDSWDKDIDITFGTVLRMTRAALPGMIARKSAGSSHRVDRGRRRRHLPRGLFSVQRRGPRLHRVLAKEIGRMA